MLLHTLSALVRLHELTHGDNSHSPRTEIEKTRCEEELSLDLLKRYQILEERHGESAVVPVTNSICGGCFIRQPNSGMNEIASQLYQCQHCGRILYDPEDLYEESGF